MSLSDERRKILDMVDQGFISAEDGYNLLQALESTDEQLEEQHDPPDFESAPPSIEPLDPEDINRWKQWWFIPLWIGAGITALGGGLLYWAWRAAGFSFWFACAWFPFLMGVFILGTAWGSQYSPWLHVRVQQKAGESPQRIAISFPLPLRLTAWALRTFGHLIPKLDATGLDEVIMALGEIANEDAPIFIDVSEGKDGEKVQVFIG